MASATPTGSRVATAIGAGLGHSGRLDRAGDSQPQGKVVLPQLPGAAPPLGTSLGRGRPGAYVNGCRPARSTGWWRPSAWPACPRIRCLGCAVACRSPPCASAPWGAPTRTCGWTPKSRRCAGGRVEHRVLLVAYAVHATGHREVIGLDVGAAETQGRSGGSSCARWCPGGLRGVQLVASDAHEGLKQAI